MLQYSYSYYIQTAFFCKVTIQKKYLWIKFVKQNWIYIIGTDFFIWTVFEKLMEFHMMLFQTACIWLIQTKLVLIDNRPTKFHQRHSADLEIKDKIRWTLHAHYTSFSWTSTAHNSEIMYKIQVMQNYFFNICCK
jgi:hypothetical protein